MIENKQKLVLENLIELYQKTFKENPDLLKYSEYAITYHSTAIEGSTLNQTEVIELLDINKPAKNRDFLHNLMVFDHHNALRFISEAAIKKEEITEKFIQTINAMVMKNTGYLYNTVMGDFDSSKGEYRLVSVHAGKKSFPDYKKVPKLMKDFIEYIRQEQAKPDLDVLQFAFDVHFKLVSIHPFVDGNGRVARLIMNYILACYNKPIFIVSKADRIRYIDILYKTQENGKMKPYYKFMMAQYTKFLKAEIKRK